MWCPSSRSQNEVVIILTRSLLGYHVERLCQRVPGMSKHVGIQHVPANELHAIIKPSPFRGWALDLIGEIIMELSKSHMHILAGIYYFTKCVKAVPLVNIDQDI